MKRTTNTRYLVELALFIAIVLVSLLTSLMAGKVLIGVGLAAACFSIAGHWLGSGLAIKNGAKIVRPVILAVIALLLVRVLAELLGL